MNLSKKERQELNQLSKEVFGTASRWQKLVDNGYQELVTEEKDETFPSDKEGESSTHKIQVPVLTSFGANLHTRKYHTVESVRELMLNHKKQIEELKAQLKKQQEELQAKQEAELQAKLAIENSAGSAI